MKTIALLVLTLIANLQSCLGLDQDVKDLNAIIYKEVAAEITSEAYLDDQIIIDITENSGEITISDGNVSHTIEVMLSVLAEQDFDAAHPTILTIVKVDNNVACMTQQKDGRLLEGTNYSIEKFQCDPLFHNLLASGKWDIVENVDGLAFTEDYNLVLLIDEAPNNDQFSYTGKDGSPQIFEVKLLSMTPKENTYQYTYLVTHNGTKVCTIKEMTDGGMSETSISGYDNCGRQTFLDGYTITFAGHFLEK